MKKVIFLFGILILSIFSVNAITQVNISSCPVSYTNDTEYIVQNGFSISSSPCFAPNNMGNIIINGNGVSLTGDLIFNVNGNTNLTIKNFVVTNMYFGSQNAYYFSSNNNVRIENNTITDLNHNFIENSYIGFPQSIWNNYNIYIIDNYIKTNGNQYSLIVGGGDGTVGGHYALSDYYNTTITNNEFVGFGNIFRAIEGSPSAWRLGFWQNLDLSNNNFVNAGGIFYTNVYLDSCTGKTFSNNYDSSLFLIDSDQNFMSDSNVLYSISNCANLYNAQMPTRAVSKAIPNTYYIRDPFLSSNQYTSNKRYIIGDTNIILNNTNYFNLNNVQNSILDLSLWDNQVVFDVRNVNVMKLGANNFLYGGADLINKPIIQTTTPMPTISFAYPLTNNDPVWSLITYDRYLDINNINFQLNGIGSYGLISPSDLALGERLTIRNSLIDYNFNSNDVMPMAYVGAFFNAFDNTFDIGQQPNQTIFAGGVSGLYPNEISGGHLIKNNIFIGGGLIFKDLKAQGTDYANSFGHNKFDKTSTTYSYPFSLIEDSYFSNVNLNSSITYKTFCDSYTFNIGNYYRDIDDQGGSICLDANLDNFCDDNPFFRGYTSNHSQIRDYKTLYTYPYNFAGNTGNALSHTDLCGSYAWVISSPNANQTYTTSSVTTNWAYIGNTYSNLICVETINGENAIYNSVNSSQSKGLTWSLGNGEAKFKVTCCNTPNCDDFKKESETITFCINNCIGVAPVINVTIPVIVLGCTDPLALNYNSLATQDDGSCSYTNGGGGNQTGNQTGGTTLGSGNVDFIDPNSITGTTAGAVGFVADLTNGVTSIAIPLGIFIFIVLVLLTLFAIF